MNVYKTGISENEPISKFLPVDYKESYMAELTTEKEISPVEALIDLWTNQPKWIKALFRLRDIMVKPLGLKPAIFPKVDEFREKFRKGEDYEMATVKRRTQDETILCIDDSHMIIYFSMKAFNEDKSNKKLKLSTLVKFRNKVGFLYFYSIYPFHHLLMRAMFSSAAKKQK